MIEGASLRIAVLLSTYNGESYLAEQLDSLLAITLGNNSCCSSITLTVEHAVINIIKKRR